MKRKSALLLLPILLLSCNRQNAGKNPEALKKEIIATEKAFETAAKDKGIADAFYDYADEQAVIKRSHDTLIRGRENIRKFYADPLYKNATVTWTPSFTDVSADGSLGYTFGNYTWKETGPGSKVTEYKGVFHTVWKRQANGTWKYVWD